MASDERLSLALLRGRRGYTAKQQRHNEPPVPRAAPDGLCYVFNYIFHCEVGQIMEHRMKLS